MRSRDDSSSATPRHLVVAALTASMAGCSAGSTEGVGSTAYERCPDALVDAWLALGRDDGGHASALDRVSNGPGDLPVGEVRVLCSIALTHPDGRAAFTLSVLASRSRPGDPASRSRSPVPTAARDTSCHSRATRC